MDKARNPAPPEAEDSEPFTPEAAEFEPAGGIVKTPPNPAGKGAAADDDKTGR